MSHRMIRSSLFLVALVGSLPASAAEDPYGTPEQLAPCEHDKQFPYMHNWTSPSKLSAECIAEVDCRAEVCLKDPDAKKIYEDPKYSAHSDPPRYCHEVAFTRMSNQWDTLVETRKKEAAAEKDKAKIAAQRVPKADMHDARIEKAIAATFHAAFPDSKILKVIITDKTWDFEKDAFGRVTGHDINASVVNKRADGKCEISPRCGSSRATARATRGRSKSVARARCRRPRFSARTRSRTPRINTLSHLRRPAL